MVEREFAQPWPPEARRVLPSASPATNAGYVWAPVLAYTLLAAAAESLSLASASGPALALFDQFALRQVLAQCFAQVEFAGQDTWRAAARVRLALAAGIRPSEPEPTGRHAEALANSARVHGFAPEAWQDGDLRWLGGVNEHEGATYFNKEAHEELLWWHALPDLLAVAAQPGFDRREVEAVAVGLTGALASAGAAGYRLMAEPAVETAVVGESIAAEYIAASQAAAPVTTPDADDPGTRQQARKTDDVIPYGVSAATVELDLEALPIGKRVPIDEVPVKAPAKKKPAPKKSKPPKKK